jgi:prophage regulatory protein
MTLINRILRCKDVMDLTGLSRSTIYALMQEERFPASIKLSKRAVGWREKDICDWMDAR